MPGETVLIASAAVPMPETIPSPDRAVVAQAPITIAHFFAVDAFGSFSCFLMFFQFLQML